MLDQAVITVMTWNVCTGTNAACELYRRSPQELAWHISDHLLGDPDVIFLQEFCTGATGTLEQWLEWRTGRSWTVRSWGLTTAQGRPYDCHPDRNGRPRGAQSVTVAVADHVAAFETVPLTSPPWFARRAALCATIPAVKVRACGTHLSSGMANDDAQRGAPYRHKQVRQLMAAAPKAGHTSVFGGDLNLTPGRVAAYGSYDECDPRMRWTYLKKRKIDYLFAPKGRVLRCWVDGKAKGSDHLPMAVRVAL
ncbi:endonuclease/exonuclease/phosphatase family protein [Nonomuraea dietziae]|uniref:endonuclease/exonuclease/phosphatase family protein n=1 Tax=Nonomuraea dietziae TaxID=65515 RepID=UPI0033EAC183